MKTRNAAKYENMILLGRSPEEFAQGNSTVMVFRSALVSRLHAVIGFDDFGPYIMDIGTEMDGSANGTFVNGKRILPMVPYYISNHDLITLGHPTAFNGCVVRLAHLSGVCAA
jgi:pSer/pThr/pTyr-binding forkhead associated (FHA) protein